MADFPDVQAFDFTPSGAVSTGTSLLGVSLASPASTAWPAANLAIFVPVRFAVPTTVFKIVMGAGATAAGNFDVGIYDSAGNKVVSSGATAKGASVEQILDVTDTRVGPGVYYLALSADGTNNYVAFAPSLQVCRLAGVMQMATAYPLPATATFAAIASAVIPALAAYLRPT